MPRRCWQVSDAFHLVTLGDAFVYRRDDAADAGESERRTVLPERRSPVISRRLGERSRTRRGATRDGGYSLRRRCGLVATIDACL